MEIRTNPTSTNVKHLHLPMSLLWSYTKQVMCEMMEEFHKMNYGEWNISI